MKARTLMASAAIVLCAHAQAQAAPAVVCHLTYGGEDTVLRIAPDQPPYTAEPAAVGSYFLFKVLYQSQPADIAGVHIYVYGDREPVPVPIQQVSYAYPLREQARRGYGFTGRQRVYEPIRDGELEYWCELQRHGGQP
jgi:hypothetical protein